MNTRKRPVKDAGERELKMSLLSEMEEQSKKRIADNKRIPLAARLKLDWADQNPDYHYYWATDSQDYPISLQDMCDAGFVFERHQYGQRKGDPVIQNSRGCNLYLMKQPKELHLEDMARQNEAAQSQYRDNTEVGEREYAGDSKKLGEGNPVTLELESVDDAISLMGG